MVLEKTLERPFESKEIQPVHPKGNQSWIFIGRTNAEAEIPILCPPDGKNWFIGKDPDAGKDWKQEEKGMTEDEMIGWCHQLSGVWASLGVVKGQGGLVCCSPWGCKQLNMTEWLNWTELDCSLPGSFVHMIFQARILEWFAISFSLPRDQARVSHRFFTVWSCE